MNKVQHSERQLLTRRQLLTTGAVVAGASGVAAVGVAGAPPAAAAGAGWAPIQFRSVDTRGWGYKPVQGDYFQLDLTDDVYGNYRVPPGAIAVSYNLTITETEGAGNLAMWRFGDPDPGVSSINWRSPGLDIANGGICGLGNSYFVTLKVGGNYYAKTHFIVDVTGYFSY